MKDPLIDYTDQERRLFAALPRTSEEDPRREDAVVAYLRDEGFLGKRRRRWHLAAFVAIAASLVVAAWLGGLRRGAVEARRGSIEAMLTRSDLSRDDRVLLMQRAGSAYVEAAHAYAASVATMDSTAMEVSSQVLIGAAQAVARTNLDGGMAPRLAAIIRDSRQPQSAKLSPVIWY